MMLVIHDWDWYAFILSFLGVIVSLIFYLLYKIFQEPVLLQVSKEEMNYAITTVLLVVIVGLLVGTNFYTGPLASALYKDLSGVFPYTPPAILNKYTPVDLTISLINTTRNKYISSRLITTMYFVGWPAYVLGSFSEGLFMTEVQSGAGWRPISEMLSNIYKMTAFYTWIFYIILQILYFIKYFWGVIFTLGIVLRAFQPTRGAGAYLIALALGLYFIFPLSYLMGEYTALVFIKHSVENSFTYQINSNNANTISIQGSLPNPSVTSGMAPSISTSPDWMVGIKNIASSSSWTEKIGNYLKFYENIGVILYSTMCILPMVALVITITFVLSTTSIFGGNIPEISRGIIRFL